MTRLIVSFMVHLFLNLSFSSRLLIMYGIFTESESTSNLGKSITRFWGFLFLPGFEHLVENVIDGCISDAIKLMNDQNNKK